MRSRAIWFWFLCGTLAAQTAQESIEQGIEAYKAAQFDEAIENFRLAVASEPKSTLGHLYLATAYLADLYAAPGDVEKARRAEQQYARVLELDPQNLAALTSLMQLSFQKVNAAGAAGQPGLLDEARQWCTKLLAVDPMNNEAHYTLGAVEWLKFYPAYQAARSRTGLKPDEPGPFKDARLRAALRKEWGPALQDGIDHLQRALDVDPHYDPAMVYMNLLLRRRADLADNPYAYQAEMLKAEAWAKKAGEARRQMHGTATPAIPLSLAPPPLPVPAKP